MAEGCLIDSLFDTGDINSPCQPCSRKNKRSEAVIYCADCDEIQCLICSKDHETYVVMEHHVIFGIDDWKHSNDFLDLAKISKCEMHGLTYEYFCEQDNRLCCQDCRKTTHRTCCNVKRIVSIDHQYSGEERKTVDSKFKELLNDARKISSMSEERKSCVKNQMAEMPSIIDDIRKSFLNMIDRFEVSVLKEGESIEFNRMASLEEIQSRTSAVVSDIQNTLTNIKSMPKSMTPEQTFVFEKKMDEILNGYENKIKLQAAELRNVGDTVSVQFSEKLLDFLKTAPNELGKLNTDSSHVDSDFLLEPKPVEIRHITTTHKRSSTGFQHFYIGMDFLQNGRLALADHVDRKCVIMSASLNVIGEQRLKYAPQNLLVFGNDELLISSGDKRFIDHFQVNSENILTYKKRIETLSPCDSLSLVVDNIFAVGIADKTQPVCKLKGFNQFFNFDVDFYRENYKLGETKCAYCHSLEILVLTDYARNTIAIINPRTGEKLRVQDKVIQGPRGVVIGKDGSIFVCCEDSCCLVQLSPSGEILSFRKLRINFPHSICISKDFTKLAISNNSSDDCLIQLFLID